MTIKKIGHCCLLIKVKGLVILTDPGAFSSGQSSISEIDVILITHEHFDHLHIDSLKEVLKGNTSAQIFTNSGVGALLEKEGISYTLLEDTASTEIRGVSIEALDGKHEEIFETFGQVQNTGYFIDEKLFYPGDSFTNPGKSVDVLALPVAGPWCSIAQAIRYALSVRPKTAFPVHDGMLMRDRIGGSHLVPSKILPEHGIDFVALLEGEEKEF